jgi:hypothetical protein
VASFHLPKDNFICPYDFEKKEKGCFIFCGTICPNDNDIEKAGENAAIMKIIGGPKKGLLMSTKQM